MAEVTVKEPARDSALHHFLKPRKALYATCGLWDPDVTAPPFLIREHAAFVLGTQPYRLLPFPNLREAIVCLSRLGAIEIKPSDLRGRHEADMVQERLDNLSRTYILHNNVYMRFQRGGYSAPSPHEAVHTFAMLGAEDAIVETAQLMGLPHPFDDSAYPYRDLFRNPRDRGLPVLK